LSICLFSAASIAAFACGGGTEPLEEVVLTMQNVAGIYYGGTITTEKDGVVTDQFRLGARIELILYEVGASGGRITIPPDDAGWSGIDADLTGTWELHGNIVTLSHSSDTFLHGIPLPIEETHLTGEATVDGVTYRVVLAR